MRTHTTAVSSRMLYKLAQEGFKPKKYFSIDRVFRNEAVDRTHLAEFHQIEGVICDKGLTLSNLIGVLHEFFQRIGALREGGEARQAVRARCNMIWLPVPIKGEFKLLNTCLCVCISIRIGYVYICT